MKQAIGYLIMALGWILLILFLISGFYYNKLSEEKRNPFFTPLSWNQHLQVFSGAIECSLISSELAERKQLLKEEIFSKVTLKQEVKNGYLYFLDYDPELLSSLFKFIETEKACCPFFQFDLSILPFGNGIALQISGSAEAFELLDDFEKSEF